MTEYYPGDSPETGSGGPENKGKKSSKTEIKKSAGYETLKFGEGLKPLDEKFKTPTAQKPAHPEMLNQSKPADDAERWQHVSAEELRARAAQDAAEQLARHQQEILENEKEKSAEADDDEGDSPQIVKHHARPARSEEEPASGEAPQLERHEATKVSPEEGQEFADIVQSAAPELVAATSGERLVEPEESHSAAEPLGPEAAQNPHMSVDERVKPEDFSDWVRNEHPEVSTPEMAAASNPDDGFNDIVRNSLGGEPPGETRYFEQAPGEPPVDAGAGGNRPPNFPPTAEGGAWGNNENGSGRGLGGSNTPNPNVLNNPWTPAGGLRNPGTWAAISALEARQSLNSLRHTAAEVGLAGAVVLLGMGHFRNRHKIDKLQRQNRRQGEQINRMGQQLQQEQAAHQTTRSRLEQVSKAQTATAERFNQPRHEAPKINPLEAAIAGAPIATSSRQESAPSRPANRTETAPAPPAQNPERSPQLQNQELNRYLENNREAARALKKNPELRGAFEAAAVPAVEIREPGKANETTVFNSEGTHEVLQNQYLDNTGAKRPAAGADLQTVPLPTAQPNYTAASFQQPESPVQSFQNMQDQARSNAAKPIAAGAVLFIVIAILFFVFVR